MVVIQLDHQHKTRPTLVKSRWCDSPNLSPVLIAQLESLNSSLPVLFLLAQSLLSTTFICFISLIIKTLLFNPVETRFGVIACCDSNNPFYTLTCIRVRLTLPHCKSSLDFLLCTCHLSYFLHPTNTKSCLVQAIFSLLDRSYCHWW